MDTHEYEPEAAAAAWAEEAPLPEPESDSETESTETPIPAAAAAATASKLPPIQVDQGAGLTAPLTSASLPPPTPLTPTGRIPGFAPLLCVVDFHHARGPEVEMWFGVGDGDDPDPASQYDWPLLPFMALSDGAHAATEDFSYFTLLRPERAGAPAASAASAVSPASPAATSLFGISCTRQIDAAMLRNRPADVTRSTVQKAVVIIADSPQFFGMLRERLSVVTTAWFDQHDFTDVDILRRFQESLVEEKARGSLGGNSLDASLGRTAGSDEDRDQYLGMSLRELVHEFRWQTLVLLKCCLLQPKMLFFGSRCERLCMMQFSLISLIPGLLRNLQDCAGPELDNYSRRLKKPTSLRTSDRGSLLAYMGLPLQIFGKGSLFGPYTPLQQLDVLADVGTKSYVVGSTNSLLLQQRDRYSDILINLDEQTVSITSASLRTALQLSVPDRRWIDYITQEVNNTWDESNPGQPKTMAYIGSEEFIRLQFEEYLLSLLSSVRYHSYIHRVNSRTGRPNVPPLPHIEGDPSTDFGAEFIEAWSHTGNYALWEANTDSHLFEFVEPKHPCAGGLTVDDVQRRIAQQVQDMHLDERLAQGREVLGRNLAAGRDKASTMFNKFYADMEALRESQKRRAEEKRAATAATAGLGKENSPPDAAASAAGNGNDDSVSATSSMSSHDRTSSSSNPARVDVTKGQQTGQTAQSVGGRASAYMSSWASWAGEKRKAASAGGWGSRLSGAGSPASNNSSGSGSGSSSSSSWTLLGNSAGRRANRNTMSSTNSDVMSLSDSQSTRMSVSSVVSETNDRTAAAPATTTTTTTATTPVLESASSTVHDVHVLDADGAEATVAAVPRQEEPGRSPEALAKTPLETAVKAGEEEEEPVKYGSKVMLLP